MSEWLPLILHRPELSRTCGALPDIGERRGIATLKRGYDRVFKATFERRLDTPEFRMQPEDAASDFCKSLASCAKENYQSSALVSLPLFTRCMLFKRGLANKGMQATGQSDSEDVLISDGFEIMATRSFVTWSYAPYLKREPLFQTTTLQWLDQYPEPDFSAWAPNMPMQIIVPIERPWLSAHTQLRYKSYLSEDIDMLSARLGWGKPSEKVLDYFF